MPNYMIWLIISWILCMIAVIELIIKSHHHVPSEFDAEPVKMKMLTWVAMLIFSPIVLIVLAVTLSIFWIKEFKKL